MAKNSSSKVKCPHCGQEFDVKESFIANAKEEAEKEFKEQILNLQKHNDLLTKQMKSQQEELIKQQEAIEEQLKKDFEKRFKEEANKKIKEAQDYYSNLGKEIKEKLEEETEQKLKFLQEQLDEKSKEAMEVSKLKAAMLKLQHEKDEIKEKIELEMQQQFFKSLSDEKMKLQEQAEAKYELRIAEMEKQLNDQKKLTEEMKRKQEQGSMQLQGETQELFIEKWLADTFPIDEIEEVKKGANGADCLQIVNTTERQNCGTIYYESKNTQSFGGDWIEKFKKDIKQKGATLGVLVTAVYPKGMTRMGVKDGIYICSLEEFKGLTVILREELIKTSKILASQENRHDKKEMLYNYLTSQDFAMQISGIVGSYRTMKSDLEKEKTAMMKYWKYREKQLDNVIESATSISGSIQSIANILTTTEEPMLQLPGATEDEEEYDDELIG